MQGHDGRAGGSGAPSPTGSAHSSPKGASAHHGQHAASLGGGGPASKAAQQPPTSGSAAPAAPASITLGISRQLSEKLKLNSTGLLPGSVRAAGRATSHNSRGVAAVLGASLPMAGSRGGARPHGVTAEQEVQLGDMVLG
jgi:hypothetical protein